jgi:membrane associated rhomboid family serine protease
MGAVRTAGLQLVLALVAVMWAQELLDAALPGRWDDAGIEPRDAGGLAGIVLAPFLHVGFGHLVGNTVPLLALGAVIALGGPIRVALVTAVVALVSGLGTWLTGGAGTVHLGASGLVFGFAAYLVLRGIWSRSLAELAVGVVVVALFGGSLLTGLVPAPGISWQAHLFGAVGGALAARGLRR